MYRKIQNYDTIFEERIGYGNFSRRQYIVYALIAIIDGQTTIANGLIMPVVALQFNLSEGGQASFFTAVIFFHGLASILAGKISDVYGRSLPLLVTTIVLSVFHLLSSFTSSYFYFFTIRMFLGFFFGVNDNILATVASEISTTEMRAKSNALYYISWSFGQLYMVALNYIIFDDSDVGNWRLLIQITGVIMLAMCVYIYINVVESPRFLLLSGNVDQAIRLLDEMGAENHQNYIPLTREEIEVLQEWNIQQQEQQKHLQGSISALFTHELKAKTWAFTLLRVAICFIQYQLLLILPTILTRMDIDPNRPDLTFGQKEIAVALFPIAGMVGSVISGYILDNEYMGRKLSILSMSILGVIVCGTLAFTDRFFALLIILIALVQQILTVGVSLMTSEVYDTFIRATAQGFTRSISRLATMVMPLLSYELLAKDAKYPFVLAGPLFVVAAYIFARNVAETKGIALDEYRQRDRDSGKDLMRNLIEMRTHPRARIDQV